MIDIRKLKELVRLMVANDLTELDLRDSEEQVTLRSAAEASTAAQREFWSEYEAAARVTLEEAGVQIFEIPDLAPFRRAVEPLYELHSARYGALAQRIREAAGRQPDLESD